MKKSFKILLGSILFLSLALPTHADLIVGKLSTGWSMLNSSVDPAIADADFNETWFNPIAAGYDGPLFTLGQDAPFQFDNVTGLFGGTLLTHKQTSYFYRTIDGGAGGFDHLKLSLLADDAAFVYLNGVLIARDGIVGRNTYSGLAKTHANENSFDVIRLFGTPKLLPGENLLAISIHDWSINSSDLGFDLKLEGDPIEPDVIVPKGSTRWRVLNTDIDPATTDPDFNITWFNPTVGAYTGLNYDGPSFTSGWVAPFQFDNLTGLSGGTTLPYKRTSYFYRVIDGGAEGYRDLKLSLLADDGAFVYLNGSLIARDGVSDPDTYDKLSLLGDENRFDDIPLIGNPTLLPGENLLAISVHDWSLLGSSDLGFDLQLEAYPILVNQEPQTDALIKKGSESWSVLNVDIDPATVDPDFNTTWFNPSVGSYMGLNYDGLLFTPDQVAPFQFDRLEGLFGGTTLRHKKTSYFYHTFDGGSGGCKDLKLSLLADDGAFIYLNGSLIARDGVSDPDTYDKLSLVGDENRFDDVPLIGNPTLLPGENLLAISVHDWSLLGSSDLGFDLELTREPSLVRETDGGWAMLSPVEPATGDGFDPVAGHAAQTADLDFNDTWKNQTYDGYAGVAYDGPAFTTGHQGPFQFGGVNGIWDANTMIPAPNLGTRGAAYFIKTFDGCVNGYDQAEFTVLADDGAFIYLNGELVGVIGDLPYDATQDTWGKLADHAGQESTVYAFTVAGTNIIKPGPNLLAVSLHQWNPNSSDLGFRLKLVGQVPRSPTIDRGPYLQSASHESMTVKWRTTEIGNSILRYGDAPNNLTQTVMLDPFVTDHEIALTGLDPATRYYYQIESANAQATVSAGADLSHYFQTHPLPGSATPTKVWVIGDSGTAGRGGEIALGAYNVYDAYLTRAGAVHTDVWLLLGDNAYSKGTDTEYQDAVFEPYKSLMRKTSMWSTLGNHDSATVDVYDSVFTFPTAGESGGVASGTERYYSFDHGNIHFICIDSQTSSNRNDVPGAGGMIDWLELDLQSTDKDWIIAYFHHGPYTKGSHDSDREGQHIQMRRYVTPLLEKYGVDLVFSGHSHCYERSMLINGHHSNMSPTLDSKSSTFSQAIHAIDNGNGSTLGSVDHVTGVFGNFGGDGAYQKPFGAGEAGAIYSTCGASGWATFWTGGSRAVVNPNPHPVFIVNLLVMGSMILTIDGDSLNAQYIDQHNVIRDDFTILKSGP